MNNKISNQFLKQLISEISNNANKGRISVDWGIVNETKKKKKVKEADEPAKNKPADKSAEDKPAADGELPQLKGSDEKSKDAGQEKPATDAAETPADATAKADPVAKADTASEPKPSSTTGSDTEEADKAEKDAAEAKAKLAKAQAEKAQAEKEIKKQTYISLKSGSGTQFLLGKVLDQAFKTNTIDALAGEMVNTLKINTPEDLSNFSEDVVTYMAIPGMPELLSSMKTLANKEPAQPEEEPTA